MTSLIAARGGSQVLHHPFGAVSHAATDVPQRGSVGQAGLKRQDAKSAPP